MCCRATINSRVDRIRRAFRWVARKRLVPVEVVQSIATVPGLQWSRAAVPESEKVLPVRVDDVKPRSLSFRHRSWRWCGCFARPRKGARDHGSDRLNCQTNLGGVTTRGPALRAARQTHAGEGQALPEKEAA